ncbi:unnamed protein product (macronuclear) [Paramecium tetraurelia]|uniref:Uncharacterized protein n=1 Tax=Paramecium tetraurelia TaxID=5888 RepID=A0BJV7_PARTE|nr:uncharacterized protein GSPATT00029454001 [Paramecium tetraurelia]CAK58824.1 unnamed protein product [Paramecium tetraurelia]|eukprot:XP_001426222.1 hypothetical protein (macronuclear) [Paramecium tetraurelia strain d4-2]
MFLQKIRRNESRGAKSSLVAHKRHELYQNQKQAALPNQQSKKRQQTILKFQIKKTEIWIKTQDNSDQNQNEDDEQALKRYYQVIMSENMWNQDDIIYHMQELNLQMLGDNQRLGKGSLFITITFKDVDK